LIHKSHSQHIICCIYHRQKFLSGAAEFRPCVMGFTVAKEAAAKAEEQKASKKSGPKTRSRKED
jgi:hypothetical protein